jgi:ribosomal protein S18 acetylase RimI-like enzyme
MSSDAARSALKDESRGATEVALGFASPNEFDEVRRLIEAGLARRWGSFDASRNRDLIDFAAVYGAAPVVAAKSAGGAIVGCGILVDEAPGIARIVRMSVAHDRERRGIGGRVLAALIEHARTLRYREIVLETTETWESAVAFYRRHGFIETHRADGDVHFRYPL